MHGVVHHFYQIHLAAPPGHGPDYGHFVSKDFVTWAELPVAIWNGFDSTTGVATPYDNEAIYTGSAVVVDGAGPGGQGPGVVNIYPGLCNKNDWPGCTTGTLLAQAVPADYAGDELLVNWTKPSYAARAIRRNSCAILARFCAIMLRRLLLYSYNPIIEGTQRDPSTPWKDPTSGEWRLRTFDSIVYGSASDADLLAGKWYTIGTQPDFRQCECPSVYPLPAATPGTEDAYAAAARAGALPTTVHKTSCGGDWWQLGTYSPAPPKTLGAFNATAGCAAQISARNSGRRAILLGANRSGRAILPTPTHFTLCTLSRWDDLFAQRKIDQGKFYASKDNLYPTAAGGTAKITLAVNGEIYNHAEIAAELSSPFAFQTRSDCEWWRKAARAATEPIDFILASLAAADIATSSSMCV